MNPSARRALLDHYDRAKRDLPWRGERDPYRILVSEVMLQQTRVDTVLRYYEPWLERFPDVDTLGGADADDVLKAWEGLGYYRRARNLHAAAAVVRERPGGDFPDTYEELRELPGVGAYTAGAVASIAFGERVPAVDGNVRRVLSRWYDEPAPTDRWLRERADQLVDSDRPGDWNQALMELGATVCTPRPQCASCPVAAWCAAHASGTQLERPAPKKRAAPRPASYALAVLEHQGRVLLMKRPDQGMLAGMWAFPEREVAGGSDKTEVAKSIASAMGAVPLREPRALEPVEHAFSHVLATYLPVVIPVRDEIEGEGRRWVDPLDPDDLALPVAQRKVLEQVREEIA